MTPPKISATISDTDKQAVKDAVAGIRKTLSFLVNLPADDIRKLFKAGNSLTFVEDALDGAKNNAGILPANFDLTDFQQTVDLFVDISELNVLVQQLSSEINGTTIVVGSRGMNMATQVYGYAQAALKTTPGIQPLVDKLADRFAHTSAATPQPNAQKAGKSGGA